MMSRRRALPAGLALCLGAAGLAAQPLPALPPQEARAWGAVGIVNADGAAGLATCSGALVAPDLVLTAAHCVATADGAPFSGRKFTLGGLGTRARLEVASQRIEVHPDYTALSEGFARYAVDLALVTLAQPVPPEVARPLRIAAPPPAPFSVAVIGFHRLRPQGLNGRTDCAAVEGPVPQLILVACPVVSGNSGAPVSARTGDGWRVAGVAVARIGGINGSAALVARLDDWIRARIDAARDAPAD